MTRFHFLPILGYLITIKKIANKILNQSGHEYKLSKDFQTQPKSMNQLLEIL